jgi:hypothetical protein
MLTDVDTGYGDTVRTNEQIDVEEVLRAAHDWVWVPADAVNWTTDEYRLTLYPERASVQWSRTSRPVAELVDDVRRVATEAGSPELHWWVTARTSPDRTPADLLAAGFSPIGTVEVLAHDLRDPARLRRRLDPPDDVLVTEVEDLHGLEAASRIAAKVFDAPLLTARQLEEELAAMTAARESGRHAQRRYLAHVDGEPVATGGYTLDGPALRLWGGSVLPRWRGRGAYRALLAARVAVGHALGARFALVKAVTDTSAPILHVAGFERYAAEHCFRLALETAGD